MKQKVSKFIILLFSICALNVLAYAEGQALTNSAKNIAPIVHEQVITIGATPVPHAMILKQLVPILKKQGINLKIIEFSDYVQPNLLLLQGQLSANFFQHIQYLNSFNAQHNSNLVPLVRVEIEPMGVYVAKKNTLQQFSRYKQLKFLPKERLQIGVPNDPSNEGRALALLAQNGLLKIKSGISYPTVNDITINPAYRLTIKELDVAMLTRLLLSKQLDLAVINANFALQAGLNPMHDAVLSEGHDTPYVNIIAVRAEDVKSPLMQALKLAIQSADIKRYINNTYHGAVVAAF